MQQTWRWFGPSDPISITDIKQTGANGVVTALHHIPNGQVWTKAEIQKRQHEVESPGGTPSGLNWDVVESLPVSEAIKSKSAPVSAHLDAYKQSLRNLAECGIRTVCYNFMPVLDWTRTDLRHSFDNGGYTMRFDVVDFAIFDCFLLQRPGALQDYGIETIEEARERFATFNDLDKTTLVQNVIAGLPGANDTWTLSGILEALAVYNGITPDDLRQNLIDFLAEVVPTAEALGIKLCCHPDDPPFSLLGLPRVLSTLEDFTRILNAVDSRSNGVTFCTGSLGVNEDFDPLEFIGQHGHRIHFAHLRNTTRDGARDGAKRSFIESEHLHGDTGIVETVRALLAEERRRKAEGRDDHSIPMRPDHGHALLHDRSDSTLPGYPLIGRLRGLAELRGVILACG